MESAAYMLLQQPPQGLPVCVFKNPYRRPNWGEPYVKNPGYRDFKRSICPTGFFFTAEFGHFLVTIFFYNYFLRKFFEILVLEENPGTGRKSRY